MTKLNKTYVRVGTEYFKFIEHRLLSGDTIKILKRWNLGTIKHDESPEVWKNISKYDDFCCIPSHLNFQQVIGNLYNRYEPFEHVPTESNCEKSKAFFRHIFGSQYELGLDYVKLLLERPTQILPVLVLVSTDRNTGKTTFLNLLKEIFKGNMTLNTNEDFRSRFNSDWTNKLIIGLDEALLDKKEDSERIKNLSTAKTYKSESKGIDKVEIQFFGKLILCSNNIYNCVYIEPQEIRYWIVEVPIFENVNTSLLSELIKEIPAFLHYLITRPFSTTEQSRMWFTPEQIKTSALERLIKGNQTHLEKEIRELILDHMLLFDKTELKYTATDILNFLNGIIRTTRHQISDCLNQRFGISPHSPSTYRVYTQEKNLVSNSFMILEETKTGRYYIFTREMFE